MTPEDDDRIQPPSSQGEDTTVPAGNRDHDITLGVPADELARRHAIKELGEYSLLKELGAGGQGAVYLAEDRRLRRRVALKVLSGAANLSPQMRLRFEREAETTSRLNHAGIAKVFELGEDDGILFIAMELVDGETLESKISASREKASGNSSQLELQISGSSSESTKTKGETSTGSVRDERPFNQVIRFIEEAALALHSAHEAGLIHRDIKPANIMARPNGSPCILDFGLAHDQESQGLTLTQTGDIFGTPAYMAPEQVKGETSKIDARTDVWALGATLYECCTLVRPFTAATRHDLFQSIIQDEPIAPSRVNRKIPKDLDAIILTAIDKDKERRYATALEFAEDLRRLREYQTIHARPAGSWIKTVRWFQRNRVVAVSGILVFVSILAAATVFYVKGEDAKDSRDRAIRSQRDAEEARDLARVETAEKTKALEREQSALEQMSRALANYDRLADLKRLEKANLISETLYPPSPELIPKLEAWQERFGALAKKLAGHKEYLASLKKQALPYTDAARRRDFGPEIAAKNRAEADLAALKKYLAGNLDEATRTNSEIRARRVAERIKDLGQKIQGQGSWDFGADSAMALKHDFMEKLVRELSEFSDENRGTIASVKKRLAQSRMIEVESLEKQKAAWTACRQRIADNNRYDGLDLSPQLGLIPLGPDPKSGLEEFLHVLTHKGNHPDRKSTPHIAMRNDYGIILVLIPGGTFWMGAQSSDPQNQNYDPAAGSSEGPVNKVTLEPYFLSKYEITQAQWQRITGANPSRYYIGTGQNDRRFKAAINGCHPVEQVSWFDAKKRLYEVGLILPTESEWEGAARAGRMGDIWAGTAKLEEVARFVNLKGEETKAVGFPDRQPNVRDDFPLHGPVGSLEANAYGLHDMSGNVMEWVEDTLMPYTSRARGGRGIREERPDTASRVIRGGCFFGKADDCRIGDRGTIAPGGRDCILGVRPARLIDD